MRGVAQHEGFIMAGRLDRIARAQKARIAAELGVNLKTRCAKGPPEPPLDAYIPTCDSLALRLGGHVDGKDMALAAHGARVYLLEVADGGVDTWLRHAENFLAAEGRRRHGPFAAAARALHETAFPSGLDFLDDAVADENVIARRVLSTLRSDEHKATLAGIHFPMGWLDELEKALQESETALAQLNATRDDKRGHVDLGRAAEEEFVDVMLRLRNYVERCRASRKDVEKRNEGRSLLAPLLTHLALMKSEEAARKTRKANGKDTPPPEPSEKPAAVKPVEAQAKPAEAPAKKVKRPPTH